jgi:hypothetical protein
MDFDLEALVRACLMGLSVAFIGGYIAHLATKGQTKQGESRRRLGLAAIGLACLVGVGT